MDLNNLNITVGQLLKNQQAKKILARQFPTLINSSMVRLYSNMPLKQVVSYAKKTVSQEKIQRIIRELESI